MKNIVKLRIGKIVAKLLAVILAFLSVFSCNVSTFGAVDNDTTTFSDNQTLVLGNQSKDTDTDKYYYPNVVVNKDNVRSVIIAFKGKVGEGSKILLPADTAKITFGNGTDTYKIINVVSGTTGEEVQNYIRDIRFTLDDTDDSSDLMFIISDTAINGTVFYDSSNRHFYQFVAGNVTWQAARETALNMSIGGRKGYLATVTSNAEDLFLEQVGNNANGWIGGTRLVRVGDSLNYGAQTISETDAGTEGKYPWYWVDGPEKDNQFFKQAASSPKSYSSYTGFFKDFSFNMDVIGVHSSNSAIIAYHNFYYDSSNYKTCEPVNAVSFSDSCLIRAGRSNPSNSKSYSWEADSYSSTANVSGYYVEYGDKITGDSHENGDENTVFVSLRKMTNVAKPYIGIDYFNEELIGFDSTVSYKIKVGADGEESILTDIQSLPVNSEWFGKTLYVSVCGDGIYTADSAYAEIAVPQRHSAPTGLWGFNRTISNVNSEMEYRKADTDGEWIKITGDKVQKLTIGEYEVRYSATSTSFKSEPTAVTVQKYGADVSVTAGRKVDVALSVGITGTPYNQFKEDLISAIRDKSPNFDFNNLNIMSATSVNTSGQSSFNWLQFDHSNSSGIYNSNAFIENTGSQSSNSYNSKNYHILSEDNGTKLTFYGYGSSGYADFMILENDQQTNKKFQFAIKEYYAADALYGTGFFFNCNMKKDDAAYTTKEAAYNASKLYMDGYLAVIEYTGNSASAFKIYQFDNLNLKKFHNTNTSTSDVNTGLTSADARVSAIGSVTISSAHDLRKFVIDVSPKKVTVYYAGFDDESHSVSNVTDENSAQSFNPNSNGYKAFANMKFAKSEDNPLDTNYLGGNSTYKILEVTLPKTYGGSDFGPMTKYGSHNCGRLTKVEMSELSMSMDVVKSLSETLREPAWTEGADKFLVNLNEDPIEDFDNVSITAELLNRLKNDDIYYIGWCGNDNSGKSYQFLQKNDLRGTIISVDSTDSGTDSSGTRFYKGDYSAQINAIADCIVQRYSNNSSADAILINDVKNNSNIVIKQADSMDTADSVWPDGKWRIDYYDNYNAKDDDSQFTPETIWMSDFQCDFDKCGVYKIYYNYEEEDEPVKVISIHDAPVVTIDSYISTEGSSTNAVLTALVDDSNQATGKEYSYKWTYKNLGTPSNVNENPILEDAGTGRTARIDGMADGAVYIVTLEVTDNLFNYTVITSKQITYKSDSTQVTKTPPTAFFSLGQTNVLMKTGQDGEITIHDSSYDPSGAVITGRKYVLYKVTDGVADKTGTAITVTDGKYIVPSNTPSGEYAIGLTVTSANGTSSEMKRIFSVVNDTTAPKVDFSVKKGTLTLDNSQTVMSFSDEGGSGYRGYKYYVSTSADIPLESQWSVMSAGQEKTVTFPMINGSYYVHYMIEDNAGNKAISYEGPFVRNQILNTPAGLQFSGTGSPVLTWTGDDRITDTGKASYTVTIYKDEKVFDEIAGLTDTQYIAANIVRGGDGIYTFIVQALSEGNKQSTDNEIKYISGQISEMSEALDYIKPENPSVNGGQLNLDEGATQDKIDEVFQGHATLISDEPLEITLNSDIQLQETLKISNSIIINLNGHTIKGPNGTKESPEGKSAFEVTADNVKIILRGEGQVIGGDGYSDSEGGNGGNGGTGIDFKDTEGGSLTTGEDTTVSGGNGGTSTEGIGGNGGPGVEGNDIDVNVSGNITGGDGGNGATAGGNGGNGIQTEGDSDIKIKENAQVSGGNGGSGSAGGDGGSGINDNGGNTDISEGAEINGGNGGNGSTGNGGSGGNGVDTKGSDVDNRGNVSGGDGGSSTEGSGGNGGNAYNSDGGNVNNYDGETAGGNAGTDNGNGNSEPEAGKTENTTSKAAGGSINIPEISDDATEEMQAWSENVKNQLDRVFGSNNAGYDPENKKIILYNDVLLENPIEPAGDLSLDLNGHTLTAPSGNSGNPDGQPAIKMPDNSKLTIENTGDKEGGIYGGNGYSGQNTENGGNGGNAVEFTGSGDVNIGNNVNIKGGNGGNSMGADAGDGGSAIEGSDINAEVNGKISGGNGGNGGLTGGNGGNAIDAGDGTVEIGQDSKINGGNGGSGDVGGNGGNALNYCSPDSEITIPEDADISGGKAGSSVNGNDAADGVVSDNEYKPEGGVIAVPVTQENLDEVFGPGASEYDADTNTIRLKKDVEPANPIVVADDINLDLNGHTLKGADGTPDSPDGKPAIQVNDGSTLNVTDSSENGEGKIVGGNGADVSDEDAAGNGGNAVIIEENGTVNIGKDIEVVGGNGGNNTLGAAGNGGSAVDVSEGSELNSDGKITGGNGGYSSKGNGGNGGSAVSGNGADIDINGEATGGNGGNTNNSTATAGNGGNVVDGNHNSLEVSGGTHPGVGGTNRKENENSGADGEVSDTTSVIYNVVTELNRLSYSGNNTVELNSKFEAVLSSVLGNNRYARLPEMIYLKINNREIEVQTLNREISDGEIFVQPVYSKADGRIFVPESYVTGSIYIKAALDVDNECTVTDLEELKDAVDAVVGNIILGNDIVITEDINIDKKSTLVMGEHNITVYENSELTNAGNITGTGCIYNKGTVDNTGKINSTIRNEGTFKNSGNGEVNNIVDLGGTMENSAIVNNSYIAVIYVANNGTGDIYEEQIPYGENCELWINTFKNGTKYFVKWNTSADGMGETYTRKQIVAGENVEYIVLYAIWSEEDGSAKIGDTYYKDLKEAVKWADNGDVIELEKDYDVKDNVIIPENVVVDTKGKNIVIYEDGTLDVKGKLNIIDNGTLTNKGSLVINENGCIVNENGSMINNESGADISGEGEIKNAGEIKNDGKIKTPVTNTETGKLDAEVICTDSEGNEYSGSLKDVLEELKNDPEKAEGTVIELQKDVEVKDALEVPDGAEINIPVGTEVVITETGSLDNKGTINNDSKINNSGNLINNGDMINTSKGLIIGNGDINNIGNISNEGDIAVSGSVSGLDKITGTGSVSGNVETIIISKDKDSVITESVNVQIEEGKVTIIIESVDKDKNKSDDIIFDVRVTSGYDFIKAALGTDGIESLEESDNVLLKFTVIKIDDKADKNDEKTINEFAYMNSNADTKMTIGGYIDFSYEIKIDDQPWQKISELNNEIEFTISIPEELRGKGTYYIIRNHNGVCDLLPDIDSDPDTITFKTDRFSTYAIAYEEDVRDPGNVDAGDGNFNVIVLQMILAIITAAGVLISRKKNQTCI